MKTETNRQPILTTHAVETGSTVSIRWTSCGSLYSAHGTVRKVNRASLKVELPQALPGYPAGFLVTIPVPGTNLNGAWYTA